MKALTLTQPYATLIAVGAKKIETRGWSTSFRGPLAIHAAKGLGPVGGKRGLAELCTDDPFFGALIDAGYRAGKPLPMGAIVAVCRLVDCESTDILPVGYGRGEGVWWLTPEERAFGNYNPGRYAWLLADIRALPEPIPCKGALWLWEWNGSPASPQASQEAPGATEIGNP